MQLTEPKWYRPVYYTSRKLSRAERNYSTTEREALGIVYSLTKYRHYLLGRKFSFHVDHSALLYLVSKASLTGKIAQWKRVVVRSRNFYLVGDTLYHKGADGISRRTVRSDEKELILREAHCGIAGGHYASEATTRKIWQSGLWWPTTLKDAVRYSKECDLCQ